MVADNQRIKSIEASRGIAALLVVLYHASAFMQVQEYFDFVPIGGVVDFGFSGVDFFFILSGFIILTANRNNLGRAGTAGPYLVKRIIRIYPIYWFVCALLIPAYFLLPIARIGYETEIAAIIGSLALFPMDHHPILAIAWTLNHEMLFYLLFVLLIVGGRVGLFVLIGWQAATVAINLIEIDSHYLFNFLFHIQNLQFGLGMIAGLIAWRTSIPFPRLVALIGATAFVATGLSHVWDAEPLSPRIMHMGFGLSAALIVIGLSCAELNGKLRTPRILVFLGAASYATYLIHYPAELVMTKGMVWLNADQNLPPTFIFVAIASVGLGAGLILHVVVERRLIYWVKTYSSRVGLLRPNVA